MFPLIWQGAITGFTVRVDPAALGFAEGAIDPGLLLLHSSSLSHAADAEGGGGALLPDLGRM